jgi:hypothetical protein
VGFELLWEFLWGSEFWGAMEPLWKGPPSEPSASACHWGTERKRHQNLRDLCRREDLRHDPISGNTSEEILFQLSLTIKT